MLRTQIYLTEQEKIWLNLISRKTGDSQSTLIRKAIDKFIEKYSKKDDEAEKNLLAACGMWADRPDSDFDYSKLSEEWDRDFS